MKNPFQKMSSKKIIRTILILSVSAAILVPLLKYVSSRIGSRKNSPDNSNVETAEEYRLRSYAAANGMSADDAKRLLGKTARETDKQEETALRLTGGVLVEKNHGYTKKQMKKTKSDITGMTLKDKKAAGLLWWIDGSDSDGDGLTDKEEIEKYKSDPLKYSTSGDLFSDSYKVAHDMDPDKSYKLKGKQKHKFDHCDNVTLHSDTAYSLDHAEVDAVSASRYYLPHADIISAYLFTSFEGKAKIDLTDDLKAAGLDIKDVAIFDGTYLDKEITDYETKGNKVTLKIDRRTPVLIAKKDTLLDRIGSVVGFPNIRVTDEMKVKNFDAFSFDFHVLNLFGAKPRLYYVSTGDEQKDNEYLRQLLVRVDEMAEGDMFRQKGSILYRGKYEIGKNICRKVSQKKLDRIRNTVTSLPFAVNWDTDMSWLIQYISYTDYRYDYTAVLEEEQKEKEEQEEAEPQEEEEEQVPADPDQGSPDSVPEGDSRESTELPADEETQPDNEYQRTRKFQHGTDDFPFVNFGSAISPGGNCAGIATFAAKLFNSGAAAPYGSYHIQSLDQDVTWDISQDPENETLLNLGLYDYEDADFTGKHSTKKVTDPATNQDTMILNDLSIGQQEFVNMIGCYWQEMNDNIHVGDYTIETGMPNTLYDFSLWEKAMAVLDQHQILGCAFYLEDAASGSREPIGAHDVNIVSYEELDEPGKYLFWVYDSNYNDGLQPLEVTRYDDNSFNYLYRSFQYPYKAEDFIYSSSYSDLCTRYAIVLHDENYNVLN